MSENSTRPHSEKGVGPARRPSTRRIGASGLRNKPKWRSMRLKLAAIWRMSVQFVAKSAIGNIEDHGFKKRHRRTKAPNRDASLVKCLDFVGLLQTREIQMKVVQTGLADFL